MAGIISCLGIYLSLFTFDADHTLSWNNVQSFDDVFNHFIRKDYGSFRLAAQENLNSFGPIIFLFKNIWPVLLVLLSLITFEFKSLLKDSKFLAWFVCLIITLLFPLAMNIIPANVGEEILLRFHVMPLVMTMILIVYLLKKQSHDKYQRYVLIGVSLICVILNLKTVPDFLMLRQDSTIEDYSRNLLRAGLKNEPSIIFSNNDSSYFAMRYLQSLETEFKGKKLSVVSGPLFFHPWYLLKVQKTHPEFQMLNAEEIYETKNLKLNKELLKPNISKFNFLFTEGFKDTDQYKVTFLPVGRLIQEGSGTFFSAYERPGIRFRVPEVFKGPQHFIKKKLYYEYSHYFLAHAYQNVVNKKQDVAISDWKKALEIVPYCYPAMVNLCENNSLENQRCDQLEYYKDFTSGFY